MFGATGLPFLAGFWLAVSWLLGSGLTFFGDVLDGSLARPSAGSLSGSLPSRVVRSPVTPRSESISLNGTLVTCPLTPPAATPRARISPAAIRLALSRSRPAISRWLAISQARWTRGSAGSLMSGMCASRASLESAAAPETAGAATWGLPPASCAVAGAAPWADTPRAGAVAVGAAPAPPGEEALAAGAAAGEMGAGLPAALAGVPDAAEAVGTCAVGDVPSLAAAGAEVVGSMEAGVCQLRCCLPIMACTPDRFFSRLPT